VVRFRKAPLCPTLNDDGNGGAGCAPNCTIETFSVNVTVKKGDILSFRASDAGFLRCDSGGTRVLLDQPRCR